MRYQLARNRSSRVRAERITRILSHADATHAAEETRVQRKGERIGEMRDALSPRELCTNANLYEYVCAYTRMSRVHIYIDVYVHRCTGIYENTRPPMALKREVLMCMYVTLFPLIVQEAFEPS